MSMHNHPSLYAKAIKLSVRQTEMSEDGKFRYIFTGVLISDAPLKNIPLYEKGDMVMETVDLEESIYAGKTVPVVRALEQLDCRRSRTAPGETTEQIISLLPDL